MGASEYSPVGGSENTASNSISERSAETDSENAAAGSTSESRTLEAKSRFSRFMQKVARTWFCRVLYAWRGGIFINFFTIFACFLTLGRCYYMCIVLPENISGQYNFHDHLMPQSTAEVNYAAAVTVLWLLYGVLFPAINIALLAYIFQLDLSYILSWWKAIEHADITCTTNFILARLLEVRKLRVGLIAEIVVPSVHFAVVAVYTTWHYYSGLTVCPYESPVVRIFMAAIVMEAPHIILASLAACTAQYWEATILKRWYGKWVAAKNVKADIDFPVKKLDLLRGLCPNAGAI